MQNRELTGPQAEFRQGMVEIRKNDALRTTQCVAYIAAEWSHFTLRVARVLRRTSASAAAVPGEKLDAQ